MINRTLMWLFVMIGVIVFPTSNALAEIQVEESFKHYQISPRYARDIVFELRRNSPVRRQNQIYHGETEWELRPNFRWKQIGKLCYVEDFVVKVETEYTMPQLSEAANADEAIKAKFDRFYEALLVHEKGHHEFGMKAAREIHHLLEHAEPVRGCKVLRKRLTRDINEIIEAYDKLNQAYDVETGHGRTQGAVIS